MNNFKELRKSEKERFSRVSVSHDLKGEKERMKEVRKLGKRL